MVNGAVTTYNGTITIVSENTNNAKTQASNQQWLCLYENNRYIGVCT